MSILGPLDWVVFGGYLLVVFFLGFWLARGQRTSDDYFVGGGRMAWWPVGVSLFATAFSSISFVALPREGAYADYHLLLTYLMIPLVITPLLWFVFVPVYRRLGVKSVYEYLEVRFDRRLRRLGTLLFALYAIGWMGSMVYATGLILKVVTRLDDVQFRWALVGIGLFATLYTSIGGLRAVVWTDVLQAVTLGGGMVLILVLALGKVHGGAAAAISFAAERGKLRMLDFSPDLTLRGTFWAACSLGLFAYLPGYTTSQVTVQRYLATRDLREARRALIVNGVVAGLVAMLFFAVGTTLYVFYHQGGGGFPDLAKSDQILPHFVLTELAFPGMTGLILAGLFAAVMSTIDSGINSLTAVVVYDWIPRRDLPLVASRILCGLFGCLVVGAALVAPLLGDGVIDIISRISGSFLGLLLGVFAIGMAVPRVNAGGAIIGMLAGSVSLAIVWTRTEISGWYYGAFTCLPTMVVGFLASLAFPRPSPEQLRGLAVWRARRGRDRES